MESFLTLGKKIYNLANPREAHRYGVFLLRAMLHRRELGELDEFFQGDKVLSRVAAASPCLYEQPTRAFFYYKSTFAERMTLIREHFSYLSQRIKAADILALYSGQTRLLWAGSEERQGLSLHLRFHPGQRKEGLMSLTLFHPQGELYQLMFWVAKDKAGEWSFWIGALQGPNFAEAKEVIKSVTKVCHGCRTKNLILCAAMALARVLALKHIYAVTNRGYYAMNHIRADRKLKTDFGAFWAEVGGRETEDRRFFELPLEETRKSPEEIPTRKRAVYRKRFAFLDEVDEAVGKNMAAIQKEG